MPKSKKPRRLRRHLSASGIVETIRTCFERLEDPVPGRKLTLPDCLLSALAMFKLKYASLLHFDTDARGNRINPELEDNIKTLFGINCVPSDTAMRERLDLVDPQSLRPVFRSLFAAFQRGGGLAGLKWRYGGYLLAIDGTEYYTSNKISCPHCSVRRRRGGGVEYHHQMVAASLVNPDNSAVFPLMPELVTRADGSAKNDCEANAIKRLLPHVRREHSHLVLTVLMDALHGKAPQVRLLRHLGMNFIIGAKDKGHKTVYSQLAEGGSRLVIEKDDGRTLTFCWRNGVRLNAGNPDIMVNALDLKERIPEREIRKGGGRTRIEPETVRRFGWITDHEITRDNLEGLMEAGRSRWTIENNVFQTLKRQGYNLTHSYGHGRKWLACVLPVIMMMAFAMDRIEELCCQAFQAALSAAGTRTTLWKRMLSLCYALDLRGWDHLLHHLAGHRTRDPPVT